MASGWYIGLGKERRFPSLQKVLLNNIVSFFLVTIFVKVVQVVVSIFLPPLSLTPPTPTSYPQSLPHLALSMGPLYMFFMTLPSLSPVISLAPPLWLLSVVLYFNVSGYILLACLFY